jgi:hypothetical protein
MKLASALTTHAVVAIGSDGDATVAGHEAQSTGSSHCDDSGTGVTASLPP